MNNFKILIASVALAALLLVGSATPALAKSGGGGGGSSSGTVRHGGAFTLYFAQTNSPAGDNSTCTGGFNLSTYVTTLTLDYKCLNLDLADGTVIYANVYTTDYFSGLPWAPLYAGTSTVLRGKAAFNNPNVYSTGLNGLPVMRYVVLSLEDGTPIFVGHP
jgi:hypothetical protein